MIAWPALLGTVLVILAFLPLPVQFMAGWLATSLFWLFAAGGASLASEYATGGGNLRTRPVEYLAAAVALAAVRILVAGASLAP